MKLPDLKKGEMTPGEILVEKLFQPEKLHETEMTEGLKTDVLLIIEAPHVHQAETDQGTMLDQPQGTDMTCMTDRETVEWEEENRREETLGQTGKQPLGHLIEVTHIEIVDTMEECQKIVVQGMIEGTATAG